MFKTLGPGYQKIIWFDSVVDVLIMCMCSQVPPDIQLQRGPDGRANGEAYITFASRNEAERAITERNRKLLGNRFIELHMA